MYGRAPNTTCAEAAAPSQVRLTQGGHGLVNEGVSAQAEALLVEDLQDGGDVRAAHPDPIRDQVSEGLQARAGAQVVLLGDLTVVVGQRPSVGLDAGVRVLCGDDR